MHEMSYIVRMVNLAQETLLREERKAPGVPLQVRKIVVQVGEMTGVIPAYLHRYYPEAVKNTRLASSVLETEILEAKICCADCGVTYHPERENDYRCPGCGSTRGKATAGREVILKEVVL